MKPPKNFYNNLDRMKQDITGGADVPTPSAEDAGKAIVVSEEGKYELGSVGSEEFIISTTSTKAVDKTDTEIQEALDNGKIVVLHDNHVNGTETHTLKAYLISGWDWGGFVFMYAVPSSVLMDGAKGLYYIYQIYNERLTWAKGGILTLPEATSSDAGKALIYDRSSKSYVLGPKVPVPTTADAGKSLKVGSDGKYYLDFNSGLEVAEKNYFQLQGDSSAMLLDGVIIAAGDKIDVSYHTNGVPSGQCSVINTSDASWDARRNLSIHYADREWYISNNRVGDWSEGDVNILYDLAVNTAYQVTESGRTALVTNIDSAIFVGKTVRFGPLQGLGGKNYAAYIKSVKIYDSSNVLKHDLVPVAVGESASFLMDKVTNKLYANSGLSRAIDTI